MIKACTQTLSSFILQAFFIIGLTLLPESVYAQTRPEACLAEGTPCGCAVPPEGIEFSPEIDGLYFQNIRLMPVGGSDPFYKLYTTLVNGADHPYRLVSIKTPLGEKIRFTTQMDGREEVREAPFNLLIAQGAVLPLDEKAHQYLTIQRNQATNLENTSVPVTFHFAEHRDITVSVPLFSDKGLVAFQPKIGPDGNCAF